MSDLRTFHGPNSGYVLDLFDRYRGDPNSVDESWRAFFESFTPPTPGQEGGQARAPADGAELSNVVGAHELAAAIRARGHTAARLSPFGVPTHPDPALRPESHGIRESDLETLPPGVVRRPAVAGASNAREAIEHLRSVYSGTTGYEFDHIIDAEEREWLRVAVETGRFRVALTADEKKMLLHRLSEVEGFEKYLHKTFFGQKRFSIEGTDMMVPMLDTIIHEAGAAGAHDVVIGMAHRGRLNVLTHVLRKPAALIIGGFTGSTTHPLTEEDLTGDVKYHLGWRNIREVSGHEIHINLAPNPSHLEFVDPVVIGMTRAAQDNTDHPGAPIVNAHAAVAVLIHGDAAFPGQGIVAETLNMSQIEGYAVGGTLHVIANNQIGFTTLPSDERSTHYASDLAKGYEIPIVHVNADDPEACLAATRLAHAYREHFHKDFMIDLVGYRRWGHNEGDEPAFTQPLMYDSVHALPTVRALWAERLEKEGLMTREEAEAELEATLDELARVKDTLPDQLGESAPPEADIQPKRPIQVETSVSAEVLRQLNEALLARPEGFTPNRRLAKQLERRRDLDGEDATIDWGHGEALAFASLLAEGIPVRLSGQDAERGTFSHRHLVLHDAKTGATFDALERLPQATASFEVHNSPLSEMAVVGFEYGYSAFDPDVLVIWEAQFGDFANGAQVIIDQFISASYQKWRQRSGLVLLLPHGYEGQGPEHSSARLERFLQLAAEGNLRVVNCTTAAQYFHLLRRQAALLDLDPRPLVVMSPKSLLRHPLAASRLDDLAEGRFHPLLLDPSAADRAGEVTRLLLCTGKISVDLVGSDLREPARNVALARVEELYPLPDKELRETVARFPALREIVWVQEEPRNMGAWSYIFPRLLELAPDGVDIRFEGRPRRASPAEGYASQHAAEQARIIAAAWEGAEAPQQERKARRA